MPRYFKIPHSERQRAKELGARWAKDVELWYAPDGSGEVAEKLARQWREVQPLVPVHVLPGEDLAFASSPRLSVELVPSTCWLTGLRDCLSPDDFKRLRMGIRQRSGKQCDLCDGLEEPDNEIYLDAVGRFDYVEGKQVLRKLSCVCTRCRNAQEFGQSQLRGLRTDAFAHLMSVNGWTKIQTMEHVHEAFAVWSARSRLSWEPDLSLLVGAGLAIQTPQQEEQGRRQVNLDDIRPVDMGVEAFLATLPTVSRRIR